MITLQKAPPSSRADRRQISNPTSPQTVMEWIKAIRDEKVDPQTVITECKLFDEGFDYVLRKAYEKNGGYPLGV